MQKNLSFWIAKYSIATFRQQWPNCNSTTSSNAPSIYQQFSAESLRSLALDIAHLFFTTGWINQLQPPHIEFFSFVNSFEVIFEPSQPSQVAALTSSLTAFLFFKSFSLDTPGSLPSKKLEEKILNGKLDSSLLLFTLFRQSLFRSHSSKFR